MLNLFLILAFSGMIILSAGFAGVTFMQGVQASLDSQITTQRLLDVATQVQSHGRYLDPAASGSVTFSLPAGTTGSSPYAYNQVPSFVTGFARGANGVPFEYCPYALANNGGTAGTITVASGSTYAMKYTTTNSQNYVTDNNGATVPTTASSAPVGLLVAAAPNRFYPPDCSAVTTDSAGNTTVSGGQVAVIANDSINEMRVPGAMTDLRYYVSTTASGDASGRDASNYATLSDVLTIISSLKPASAIIYVNGTGSPTYNITTTNGSGNSFSWGTRIHLEGINGSGAIINTSSSITVDEYSTLSLGNLTLNMNSAAGTLLVNGTLEMADSSPSLTVGTLQVYGGTVKGFTTTMTVNGNVTVDAGGMITSSGPMIFNNLSNRGFNLVNGYVYGGTTMQFNPSTSGIVPIILGAGGDLITGNAAMTINAAGVYTIKGGMVISPGARFIVGGQSSSSGSDYYSTGGTVTVNNVGGTGSYGFYVHGEMDIAAMGASGAVVSYVPSGTLTSGIVLASGGKFQLAAASGVTIGSAANRPTVGIQDNGGSQFFTMGSTGDNTIYASSACWQASKSTNLFSDSQSGTVTGNSTATQTTTFPSGWYRLYNNSKNLVCAIT